MDWGRLARRECLVFALALALSALPAIASDEAILPGSGSNERALSDPAVTSGETSRSDAAIASDEMPAREPAVASTLPAGSALTFEADASGNQEIDMIRISPHRAQSARSASAAGSKVR